MHLRLLLPVALSLFFPAAWLPAVPANLAPAGTASASTSDFGSVPADINDGNRDGGFYTGGSVWHSVIPDAAPWVEVDLGANYYLDRVMIWPRTDVLQGTVKNIRIQITNAAGTEVFNQVYLAGTAADNPWGTTAMRGLTGRKVRVSRADSPVNPNFFNLAELTVYGQSNPIPPNLALNKPYTSASPGAYTTPVNAGNDGIIDGDYAHTGHPIYHSGVTAVGDYYQIDLSNGAATNQEVDLVRLFNRTDYSNNTSLKLSLKNTAGTEVWSQTVNVTRDTLVNNGRQYDITVDVPGTVMARYARVETVASEPLVFTELEVFGPEIDIIPPTAAGVDPPAGDLVAELYQTTVQFTESVTGVNAADLLINNIPTSSVTAQSATSWLFSFPQPSAGAVTFSWAAGHGITDAAANPFNGTSWQVILDTSLPAPRPYLSEFMADNQGGLEDADGDSPDWIEITNPGPTAVNLGGWYLSDSPADLTKWQFPSPVVLAAGHSLVVFASSKDRRVAGGELHTNFKLDPDGESILLVKPDGLTVASQFLNYPPQLKNVSWGTGRLLNAVPSVSAGAAAKVLIPAGPVTGWTARTGFDDFAWLSATTGVGFDQTAGLNGTGPLGYWNFNDASVPSSAVDATGRGLTGTIVTATYSADAGGRTGLPGDRAMNFGGTGVVRIPGASTGAFDAITSRNGVAVSTWVYGAATQPIEGFLFFAGSEAGGGGIRVMDAHLPWSDSVIYWDTAGCCDPARQRVSIGEPNPARWRGQWNHYVLQKDGDKKEIWQNGSLFFSGTSTDAMMNFRSLYIGAYTATGTTGYRGLIDDFAIWDGALTPQQIGALAGGASPLTIRSLAPAITTDLAASMRNVNPSALIRIPFTVTDASGLDLLVLKMRYDDGFAAWLNGTEIARRNAPSGFAPSFNAAATVARPGGAALVEEEIDVSRYATLLTEGTNVLAIQGMNASAADADFLVLPELTAGRFQQGRFFSTPSPGTANGQGYSGFVADTVFNPQRGFYSTPQTVTISCATPGSKVVYTTDGSIPSLTNGTQSPSPATVSVTGTTTLRAAAFVSASDLGPANVDTHTYLFVDQVAAQQRPAAAPVTWPGNFTGDYTMDSRIVNNPLPGYTLHDALLSIPTLSITCTPADIWSTSGIYANSGARGDSWERPASGEWLDPAGGDGFHIDFGLAIHGNISRDKGFTPKHGFKMFFRSQYGESKLEHKLFPGSPVDKFDQLILRAGSTDTFPCLEWSAVGLGPNGASYQRWARAWASYIRDQWVRDSQIAMGQPSAHGRYCHLYLNGIYWGLYNICEHPDEDFQSDHLGGKSQEYDVLVDFAELKSGTLSAWQQLMSLGNGSASDAAFQQMQGNNPDGTRNPAFPVLLNANSLIDYMLLHVFCGADDWPNHNWWAGRATRNTTAVNDGFHFFAWDQEISNENVIYERTSWQTNPAKYADVNAGNTPTQTYYALRQGSPEFRMKFADRVHRHLFNAGALTTTEALARWNARVTEIDHAIVAESARWGDYQPNLINPGQPYRRQVEWQQHLAWMAANYWPQINATALARFRNANLYPSVNAPAINPFGGYYLPGFAATLTNSNAGGAIFYTLDGSDPRLSGGATNPAALTYSTPVTMTGPTTVKARVLLSGTWSALLETVFTPDPDRDHDGIPNDWETQFGLNPDAAGDAAQDTDSDGSSNLAEYAAGTDPRDGSSVFTATSLTDTGGLHIRFTARPGRRYRLEASDSLSTWTILKSRAAVATDEEVDWVISPQESRRYYHVVAEP
ncbi:MAG TPA: chitobiase/beta-hexosaminidase C-terminal domain-containing protein [Verrucomicrobiales bacterium]|nr:chitobiase/beta-hexosaminidase C-terminal domain-containing protein [Verrucomicrobiales bacterium]